MQQEARPCPDWGRRIGGMQRELDDSGSIGHVIGRGKRDCLQGTLQPREERSSLSIGG